MKTTGVGWGVVMRPPGQGMARVSRSASCCIQTMLALRQIRTLSQAEHPDGPSWRPLLRAATVLQASRIPFVDRKPSAGSAAGRGQPWHSAAGRGQPWHNRGGMKQRAEQLQEAGDVVKPLPQRTDATRAKRDPWGETTKGPVAVDAGGAPVVCLNQRGGGGG